MKQKLNKSDMNAALKALRGISVSTSEDESSKGEESKAKGSKKKGNDNRHKGKQEKIAASSYSPDLSKLKALLSKKKQSLKADLLDDDIDVSLVEKEAETSSPVKHAKASKSDAEESDSNDRVGVKPPVNEDRLGVDRRKKHAVKATPAREPHQSPVQVDLTSIIDDMPDNSKDVNKGIMSYLNKMQYLALARAEKLLTSNDIWLDPSELVKLTTSLRDMQLTIQWTKKLKDTILNNPSKMKPGGVGVGFRLLDRVASFAKQTKAEANIDGRTSGVKHGVAASNSTLDIPEDKGSTKQVGGA